VWVRVIQTTAISLDEKFVKSSLVYVWCSICETDNGKL
jgi:hypothetical protein